jgi:hypothetical protein
VIGAHLMWAATLLAGAAGMAVAAGRRGGQSGR